MTTQNPKLGVTRFSVAATHRVGMALLVIFVAAPALLRAQPTVGGPGWLIRIGDQASESGEDGGFYIPNVRMADRNGDGVGDNPLVLRGSALINGVRRYGKALVPIFNGRLTRVTDSSFFISDDPLDLPVRIRFDTCATEMQTGQTAVCRVFAQAGNFDEFDISTDPTTTYVSSDPSIARIDAAGVVTAVARGRAFFTAHSDGIATSTSVFIRPAAVNTTVEGFAFLPDGSPAAGARVTTSRGGQSQTGGDGRFALPLSMPPDELLTVSLLVTVGGVQYVGQKAGLLPFADGVTDAGLITLAAGSASGELVHFAGRTVSTGGGGAIGNMRVADIDGDGRLEAVVAYQVSYSPPDGGGFRLFADTGSGVLAMVQDVPYPTAVFSVDVGDLDGDGDPDLVASDAYGDVVAYENLNGTFVLRGFFSCGCPPSHSVEIELADLNGDAFPDIMLPNVVALGTGPFLFGDLVGYSPTGVYAAALGDLDGDGDRDIVGLGPTGEVSLFRNNGLGTFQPGESLYAGPIGGRTRFLVGDVDSDDDLDVLVATGGEAFSLLNDGTGAVTPGPHTPASLSGAGQARLYDLDGDGDLDGVVTSAGRASSDDTVFLFNDGTGTFSAVPFVGGNSPASVEIADMNQDGVRDLIYADYSWNYGSISTHFGRADGTFEGAERINVLLPGEPTRDVTEMAAVDIDRDTRPDLVGVFWDLDRITIVRNLGGGQWAAPVNLPTGDKPKDLTVADFNGDSWPDIAVFLYTSRAVQVYLNQGSGAFSTGTSYNVSFVGNGVQLLGADLDGDDDVDLFVGGSNKTNSNSQALFNNGAGLFAAGPVIPQSREFRVLADLDNDGFPDLADADYDAFTQIRFNNGDGSFGAPLEVPAGHYGGGVTAGDLDSDGDLDLVVSDSVDDTSQQIGSIVVLINLGNRQFAELGTFALGRSAYPSNIGVRDIDADGDLDVLAIGAASANIYVLLNEGDGVLSPVQSFCLDEALGWSAQSFDTADFDADGRVDIAAMAIGGFWVLRQLPP